MHRIATILRDETGHLVECPGPLADASTKYTLTRNNYQLDKLRQAIQTLRPTKTEVHLLHDNARPHIAKLVKEKLETFGWNIIPHPPYSPAIATDFHLFRSM